MIPLSQTMDFEYRQAWGKQAAGHYDWDKSQCSNITIYMANEKINAVITGGVDPEGQTNLKDWVAAGNDPGSKQINKWPSVKVIMGWAAQVLGAFTGGSALRTEDIE